MSKPANYLTKFPAPPTVRQAWRYVQVAEDPQDPSALTFKLARQLSNADGQLEFDIVYPGGGNDATVANDGPGGVPTGLTPDDPLGWALDSEVPSRIDQTLSAHFWIQLPGGGDVAGTPIFDIRKSGNAANSYAYSLSVLDNDGAIQINVGKGAGTITLTAFLSFDSFHLISVRRNSATGLTELLVDGVVADFDTVAMPNAGNIDSINVGTGACPTAEFAMVLALQSDAQILAMYNALMSNAAGGLSLAMLLAMNVSADIYGEVL